jgi:hypothetical protein
MTIAMRVFLSQESSPQRDIRDRVYIFSSEDSETSSSATNIRPPRASNRRSISSVVVKARIDSDAGGSLVGVDGIRSENPNTGT